MKLFFRAPDQPTSMGSRKSIVFKFCLGKRRWLFDNISLNEPAPATGQNMKLKSIHPESHGL